MNRSPAHTGATGTIMTELAIWRLWQLISPALPVGAYAYSGGLEAAVERGFVSDAASCAAWLEGLMTENMGHIDLPVFVRLFAAWQDGKLDLVERWTHKLQAMRETHELLAEDRHMGRALQRLLQDLQMQGAGDPVQPSFTTMYALACVRWQVDGGAGARGLAWSWLENQVAAAIKLVPLGQTDGQRLLGELLPAAEESVTRALCLEDADLGRSLPGLAILSARHEEQYSRLFRS